MPGLVFVIMGIGLWWAGYFYEGNNERRLKTPKWLAIALGRPDRALFNAWSIAIQIMGFLLVIGAAVAWFTLPQVAMRQMVLFIWFIILMTGVAIWLYFTQHLFK